MPNVERRAPSVFISYAHNNADHIAIDFFEQELRRIGAGFLEIHRDKKNLKIGNRISIFEELINTVSCVIILFTPEYLRQIRERKGGVFREYNLICARFDTAYRALTAAETDDTFTVIPVLFSGDITTSVPDKFRDIIYGDFVRFVAVKHPRSDRHILPDAVKKSHEDLFTQICAAIDYNEAKNDNSYGHRNEIQRQLLLFETKHEAVYSKFTEDEQSKILDNIFVKTQSYMSVMNQNKIILVGRKGAGKSTIASHIHRDSQYNYKTTIGIHVDQFNLNYVANLIYTPKVWSDISNFVTQEKFFSHVWLNYVYLQSLKVLVYDERLGRHAANVSEYISVIEDELEKIHPHDGKKRDIDFSSYWPDFLWIASEIVEIVEGAIDDARDNEKMFAADIAAALAPKTVSLKLFGAKCCKALEECVRRCKRHFLFTLDGFDRDFDRFRVETLRAQLPTEVIDFRRQLELNWLRGLLHSVLDVRQGNSFLSDKIEFCLTVPKDRFLEIRQTERDDYRYINPSADIKWTAVELALLLSKRIEQVNSLNLRQKPHPLERFDIVMESVYPYIPRRINFKYDNTRIDTSLFIYLLRHTFWRPRDLMLLLAPIITTMEFLRTRRKQMDIEVLRRAVARTTFDIVRSEFINEFKTICINIEDVIQRFAKSKNILVFDDIETSLGDFSFEFLDARFLRKKELIEKIRFLYEIGFIGIKNFAETQLSTDYLFYFSDGDNVISSMSGAEMRRLEYVIHPAFNDFLMLKIDTSKLINYYSDRYLEENDAAL